MSSDARAHGPGAQHGDFIDPLVAGLLALVLALWRAVGGGALAGSNRNGNITHLGHLLEFNGIAE